MNKSLQAKKLFNQGFSCSQAVFAVFAEESGLSKDLANKISTGFGCGLAGTGETCGAVAAALMVIGLKHGRIEATDKTAKEKTNKLAKQLFEKFKNKYNSLLCKDLRLKDRSTEEKHKLAHEICSKYVEDAVSILVEIL